MKSAIYAGQVRHRRTQPVEHEFTYRLFMMYLDLAELPDVFRGRRTWSVRRPALARFRREDHLGEPDVPLDLAVRELVRKETGVAPEGPIRLLTQLAYFGYVFNPVSFYYCYNANDTELETIVAEVNNTPWGERHCYVLPHSENRGLQQHPRFFPVKEMHVSPFMQMDVDYDWRFNVPAKALTVHMENAREGAKFFDVTMVLERREISARSLAGVLTNFPFMTLKIIAAIHWQALKLWLKGAPVHDHPGKSQAAAGKLK